MRPPSSAWLKYQETVREFDATLEHAKAVSASLEGTLTPSAHATYGEQIFVTMLSHCITLRRIAPHPTLEQSSELWDLSSMCAIARCAIEAHDAFMYVAATSAPQIERDYRVTLWKLHDKTRRLKMLESLGSTRPEVQSIRAERDALAAEVTSHALFQLLRADVQRKIQKDDSPAFHLSQKERCAEAGLDFDFYNAVTMQLSQYVHTLPMALHQLLEFRAGSPEALKLVAMPLSHVLPFIGRVTLEMRTLFPTKTPDAPARTWKSMAIWAAIYSRGLKGDA
jgi:hypothetical protein